MLREFKKLMSARFFFTFAAAMQAVVTGWQMYALTHDPLHLGLIGLAEAVPALSIALYAGYVIDRSRPLVVYGRVLRGSLLSAIILFLSQLPQLHLTLTQKVWGLLCSSVITGCARGFSQPALYALVPKMMKREELSKAAAWMTSIMQIARIAGPATAGILFGWLGVNFSSACIIVVLILALISISLVKLSPELSAKPALALAKSRNVKQEILSGAVFVFKHPILLPALSLDMISVLFGGVTALLPIFADDILHVGTQGLGALRAAPALGAAILSIALTRKAVGKNAGFFLFSSVAGFGACILIFACSHNFILSLAALALSGAFDSVSMIIRTSAVQLSSPDHMRGKISAVNSIFIGSSNEIGEFESGVTAKLMGTIPSVIFGGVMCLLTVAVVAWRAPSLRKLDLEKLVRDAH